jgi:hypothetical protein
MRMPSLLWVVAVLMLGGALPASAQRDTVLLNAAISSEGKLIADLR